MALNTEEKKTELTSVSSAFNQKFLGQKILVVDDDESQRLLLRMCLEGIGYHVIEAVGGLAATKIIQEEPDLSIVITDLNMPEMSGFELIGQIRKHELRYTYIIVLTAMSDEESLLQALSLGADDYLAKPVRVNELSLRVKSGLRVIRQANQEDLILAFAKLAEYRSNETGFHLDRVQHYTRLLATDLSKHCPKFGISLQVAEEISRVSPLHDIGKVAISDAILHKPGRLTNEEFEEIKTHAAIGGGILKDLYTSNGSLYLKLAYEITMFHHEKFNGTGYPQGLAGEDIPVAARIMALADVYDAMSSKRCYKDAYTHEYVKNVICDGRGKHFDPEVVDSFLRIEDKWLAIKEKFGG